MAYGRTRSVSLGYNRGTRTDHVLGVTTPGALLSDGVFTCLDSTEPHGIYVGHDHDLSITAQHKNVVGTINGWSSDRRYEFVDYAYGSQSPASHGTLPALQNDTFYATEITASTNPSRPEVSVPNFLAELALLPFRIYEKGLTQARTGRHVRRQALFGNIVRKKRDNDFHGGYHAEEFEQHGIGNSVVEGNFGWDLLYKDVITMTKFAVHAQKRKKELERLYSKGGLSRRWKFDYEVVFQGPTVLTVDSTPGNTVTVTRLITTERKRWATIRWLPDVPHIPDSTELTDTVRRVVHGWDLSPANVWQALPWSWFADYFGNIGSVLEAQRNTVGASPQPVNLMTNTTTTVTHSLRSNSSPLSTVQTASIIRSDKVRKIVAAGPTFATLPLFGAKQLLTLASIAFAHHKLGD